MPTNKNVIYVIVCDLAVCAFLCVACICVLSYLGTKIPPELNTLASATLGALTGMLVKTSPTETVKQITVSDQPVVTDVTQEPKK